MRQNTYIEIYNSFCLYKFFCCIVRIKKYFYFLIGILYRKNKEIYYFILFYVYSYNPKNTIYILGINLVNISFYLQLLLFKTFFLFRREYLKLYQFPLLIDYLHLNYHIILILNHFLYKFRK